MLERDSVMDQRGILWRGFREEVGDGICEEFKKVCVRDSVELSILEIVSNLMLRLSCGFGSSFGPGLARTGLGWPGLG